MSGASGRGALDEHKRRRLTPIPTCSQKFTISPFQLFCWCLQGTIDMRDIGELLDAVRLIEATDGAAWPAADEAALHAWFKTYIDDWLVSQARCPQQLIARICLHGINSAARS